MDEWIVYKHANKINGKIYIGITSVGLTKRWKAGYRENKHFDAAIKKYGEENFIHEILFTTNSKEEACQKEIELIEKYKATDKNIGYNISIGGTAPMYKRHHTEKARRMFSEQRKGENNAFFGKHHSEETKRKISEARKGKGLHDEVWRKEQSARAKEWHKTHENPMKGNHYFAGENNPMYGKHGKDNPLSKPVVQLTANGEFIKKFDSITEASEEINNTKTGNHIGDCCRGTRKFWHGYKWMFYSDFLDTLDKSEEM